MNKAGIAPVCLLLASCELLPIDLPNNLTLVKMWGSHFAIVSNNEIVVDGDVTKVACRNGTIVGFKNLEEGSNSPEMFDSEGKSGYFILRAKSRELIQGLSGKAFAKSLKAMGLEYIEPTPIESTERLLFGLDGC